MVNSLENALLKCVTYVQMCLKRPQLENWFLKLLTNQVEKKKIPTELDF